MSGLRGRLGVRWVEIKRASLRLQDGSGITMKKLHKYYCQLPIKLIASKIPNTNPAILVPSNR